MNKIKRSVIILLSFIYLFYSIWIWNIRKEQEKDRILKEKMKIEIQNQKQEEKINETLSENESLKVSLNVSKKEISQWKIKYKVKENEVQRDLETYGREIRNQLLTLPEKVAQLLENLKLKPRTLTDMEIQSIHLCVQCFHPTCWSYLQKCINLQEDDLLICCLIRLDFTDTKKMLSLFPNNKSDKGNTYNNEKYTKPALDKRLSRIRRERLGKILNSYEELVLFLRGL